LSANAVTDRLEVLSSPRLAMDAVFPADTALIVVDLQPDFMPGGALACFEGDAIVPGVAQLLATRRYQTVVATQDWHPRVHASFAAQHAGHAPFEVISLHGQPQTLWPDHCVQGTPGAELDPRVDWSSADLILRKGTRAQVDSYSAFRENHGPDGTRPSTGLAGWLRERDIAQVHVCGLARDVCVLWTAQDAQAEGFQVRFLWDLTRPVTPAGDAPTRAALQQAGIAIG
jgi:nicotinamidase/pyrazinamidase